MVYGHDHDPKPEGLWFSNFVTNYHQWYYATVTYYNLEMIQLNWLLTVKTVRMSGLSSPRSKMHFLVTCVECVSPWLEIHCSDHHQAAYWVVLLLTSSPTLQEYSYSGIRFSCAGNLLSFFLYRILMSAFVPIHLYLYITKFVCF